MQGPVDSEPNQTRALLCLSILGGSNMQMSNCNAPWECHDRISTRLEQKGGGLLIQTGELKIRISKAVGFMLRTRGWPASAR